MMLTLFAEKMASEFNGHNNCTCIYPPPPPLGDSLNIIT